MAHQFWFSFPPPAAPGSSNSKSAQTDEEKQRERQRNEREQQNQQLEAQHIKRERDAREARQLDFEIRRQHEREARQSAHLEAAAARKKDLHGQGSSQEKRDSSKSPRESAERTLPSQKSLHHPDRRSGSQDKSFEGSSTTAEARKASPQQPSRKLSHTLDTIDSIIIEDSPQPSGNKAGGAQVDSTGTPPPAQISSATTTTTSTITSIGIIALRDDSTESDQSLTFSQSQSEILHRIACRAPIASLDCMEEEFSGMGGQLDFGRSISLGSNPALPIRQSANLTPGLRYKNLGKSGLRVSNVGLETWPVFSAGVPEDRAEAIIRLAVESGINLFDISDTNAEIELGRILKKNGWKRTTYAVITKIYWSTKSEERGLSRKHIIESVKASLQRLQLPYIDVVIIHKADSMCPMEEVVRAMNYVISEGWTMYWGTSRWSPVEIMEAYSNCRQFNCVTPIVEISEYHMFNREKAELYLPELYNKIGVGFMAWGPLSLCLADTQNGGDRFLFSKGSFKTKSCSYSWTEDEGNKEPSFGWGKDVMDDGLRQNDKIRDISILARKLGCSPTQLSIAWSLKHEPVQCLLLGAVTPDQLHQSLQALQLLPRLSTAVMLELERILDNKPVRPPMISTLAMR